MDLEKIIFLNFAGGVLGGVLVGSKVNTAWHYSQCYTARLVVPLSWHGVDLASRKPGDSSPLVVKVCLIVDCAPLLAVALLSTDACRGLTKVVSVDDVLFSLSNSVAARVVRDLTRSCIAMAKLSSEERPWKHALCLRAESVKPARSARRPPRGSQAEILARRLYCRSASRLFVIHN